MNAQDDDLQRYSQTLRQHAGSVHALPDLQQSIAYGVLHGRSIHEIAQENGVSEDAVWNMLESTTRLFAGSALSSQAETGGFVSDADPGVSGGYGDTGFGSIGNEPPYPTPEEPRDEQ